MEEKKHRGWKKENLTQRKMKHESERGENNFDRKAFHSPPMLSLFLMLL
jgi:hypothetical protein